MIKNLKILCVIQARMSSSRLPNKALADLNGTPAIIRMINRVKCSKLIDKIVIATGNAKENDYLEQTIKEYSNEDVYRGNDNDVLSRYVETTLKYKADLVIRLTGDCPLIDPEIIDQTIELLISSNSDYASNIINRTFPDGLDVEVFTKRILFEADKFSLDSFSREHVTTYMHGMRKNKAHSNIIKIKSLEYTSDFSNLRWTLDEQKDLDFLNLIFENLPSDVKWMDIISFLVNKPEIQILSKGININEGSKESYKKLKDKYKKSNNFFKNVSSIIPLASQTFSKSYMQWPKGVAPLFIDRAYGAKIVDIDGNHYIDYILGLLPIVLGYCDKDVDSAVINQINKGTVYSLPSILEHKLAEKLVNIIPSAEMVRFGKNGSDATTAAIRLARAYTKKDMVAVAGYHGWHDWYIGSSSRKLGVPKEVENLTKKFNFNDADSLEILFNRYINKFAAVILEPAGLVKTDIDSLKRIRHLCNKHGVILIFDEIISGFRVNLGGAQSEYGIIPDITCLGKAMANGYPLSAVVGKKEIMNYMEEIFFSSTFGGEAISLSAAIANINKIEKLDVINKNKSYGKKLIESLNNILKQLSLLDYITISNIDWWPQIIFKSNFDKNNLYTSLLRQEFLKNGLMLSSTFNLCFAHSNNNILANTEMKFNKSLIAFKSYIDSDNPNKFLEGDLIKTIFKVR
ncbi:MAG: 3-aminobutyryl-CoA aminotransferase [Alphaproteobacteria bacterium MarineAlpha9_Bin3]|nr:MAG: 3-aminobutyryl-CoA aminotransferase [Alphaproteobacteria bacterium MarineAlpha9_Bin3]|tara:strand:- start:5615 stop:7672 length:2058 start_codon:yes stop_codon:yes gene_type:complete